MKDSNHPIQFCFDCWPSTYFKVNKERGLRDLKSAWDDRITWFDTTVSELTTDKPHPLDLFLNQTTNLNSIQISLRSDLVEDNGKKEITFNSSFLRSQIKKSLELLDRNKLFLLQIFFQSKKVISGEELTEIIELKNELPIENIGLIILPGELSVEFQPPEEIDFLTIKYDPIIHMSDYSICKNSINSNTELIAMNPLRNGLFTDPYSVQNENYDDPRVPKYHPKFSKDRANSIETIKQLKDSLDLQNSDRCLASVILSWLYHESGISNFRVSKNDLNNVNTESVYRDEALSESDRNTINQIFQSNNLSQLETNFLEPPPICARHNFEEHIINL